MTQTITFREPAPADGLAVWEMVREQPKLDLNSAYLYVLWFRDFADCSAVAVADDEVIGFVMGYRRPSAPDTLFVWQEAVQARHGVPDLGIDLFDHVVKQQMDKGVKYVEATVSKDNLPIILVLKKVAKKHGVPIEKQDVLFGADHFPGEHHDEVLYRFGPLT